MAFDLILKGGRIVDPSQSLDCIADIGFAAGKVAKIGTDLAGDARTEVRDVSGHIVSPGLIDLHTHDGALAALAAWAWATVVAVFRMYR